jgi:hypothetical protein
MAAKCVLELIEKEAQFKLRVKSTIDIPMKTQREAEGVDVTIRKPAVEGSRWSATGCGHFNPRKDRVLMVQKTQFMVLSRNFSSCADKY